MIDVPEYVNNNISFIEQNRSPEFIFLTRGDNVADTEMFRDKFGTPRMIHESQEYAVTPTDITLKDSLETRENQLKESNSG